MLDLEALNPDGSVRVSALFDAQGGESLSASLPADPYAGFGGQWGYRTDWQNNYPSSLVLCGHRFYDLNSGRFINRDPCDYDGGINLYAFCQNNPVNLTDAIGLMPSAQPGCKESAAINAGIRLACAMIKGTTPAPGKHSDLCPTSAEKSCLKNLCNSSMTIFCGNPQCASQPRELGNQGARFGCHITVCTGNIGKMTEPGVSNTINQIALTIIHEMFHCCGRGDNGGAPLPGTDGNPSNPADAGARCCAGLGPPYKQGYGR